MERKIKNYLLNQGVSVIESKIGLSDRNSFSRSGNPDHKPVSSAIFTQGSVNRKIDQIPLD